MVALPVFCSSSLSVRLELRPVTGNTSKGYKIGLGFEVIIRDIISSEC